MRKPALLVIAFTVLTGLGSVADAGGLVLGTFKTSASANALKIRVKKLTGQNRAFNNATDKIHKIANLAMINTEGATDYDVAFTKVKHTNRFGIAHVKIKADIHILGADVKRSEVGFKTKAKLAEVEKPQ